MDKKDFDSLPVQAKIVPKILAKNGMYPIGDATATKGRRMDNPIVIGVADGHVPSEYLVSDSLLHNTTHKFKTQISLSDKGRHIDKLVYEVSHPDGTTNDVSLYYDITEGFNNPPEELLNLLRNK